MKRLKIIVHIILLFKFYYKGQPKEDEYGNLFIVKRSKLTAVMSLRHVTGESLMYCKSTNDKWVLPVCRIIDRIFDLHFKKIYLKT